MNKKEEQFIEYCDLLIDLTMMIDMEEDDSNRVRLTNERNNTTKEFFDWFKNNIK